MSPPYPSHASADDPRSSINSQMDEIIPNPPWVIREYGLSEVWVTSSRRLDCTLILIARSDATCHSVTVVVNCVNPIVCQSFSSCMHPLLSILEVKSTFKLFSIVIRS